MAKEFMAVGQWVENRKREIIANAAEMAEDEAAHAFNLDTGDVWDAMDEYDNWKKGLK